LDLVVREGRVEPSGVVARRAVRVREGRMDLVRVHEEEERRAALLPRPRQRVVDDRGRPALEGLPVVLVDIEALAEPEQRVDVPGAGEGRGAVARIAQAL